MKNVNHTQKLSIDLSGLIGFIEKAQDRFDDEWRRAETLTKIRQNLKAQVLSRVPKKSAEAILAKAIIAATERVTAKSLLPEHLHLLKTSLEAFTEYASRPAIMEMFEDILLDIGHRRSCVEIELFGSQDKKGIVIKQKRFRIIIALYDKPLPFAQSFLSLCWLISAKLGFQRLEVDLEWYGKSNKRNWQHINHKPSLVITLCWHLLQITHPKKRFALLDN